MKMMLSCMMLMTFLATQHSNAYNFSVPDAVEKSFQQKYPDAEDVNWSESDDHYVATFYDDEGYTKQASFDENGVWLKTTTDLDEDGLPENISEYIMSNYGEVDYFNQIIFSEKPDGHQYLVAFEIGTETVNLTFDGNGSLLKK